MRQVWVQDLRGEFEHLEMEETKLVIEYIPRVEKVVNQLSMNGEEIPPNWIVEKILKSITDNFKGFVGVIEESKNMSLLIGNKLAGSLEAHEQRKKKMKELGNLTLHVKCNMNGTQNTQGRGSRVR